MGVIRPVLRWHGGKWRLAPWIISHFSPHSIYTEAFGGAASVLLRKNRSYAEIYNDLDGEVVNLFRVLQSSESDRLIELLRLTPFARDEFDLAYQKTDDPIERARRLVIVSFMGFGSNAHNTATKSGFRSNSNRSGTTPAHDWANFPPCLQAIIERLNGVVIENKNALDVIITHDRCDALHYVDPPYVHSTRDAGGTQRDYRFELDDEAHRSLASVLKSLKGSVVLSGYPSSLYEELYGDWHRFEKEALADGARKRTEVLWLNDSAYNGLEEMLI